jgi:hypothetical protein
MDRFLSSIKELKTSVRSVLSALSDPSTDLGDQNIVMDIAAEAQNISMLINDLEEQVYLVRPDLKPNNLQLELQLN